MYTGDGTNQAVDTAESTTSVVETLISAGVPWSHVVSPAPIVRVS